MTHMVGPAMLSLLMLAIGPAVADAARSDQAIVDKMRLQYNLDTASYEIEILSNKLQTAAVTAAEIVIHPLTLKEPLGLFAATAKVHRDGEIIESGQVRMKISRLADVVVLTDAVKSREPLCEDKLSIRRMDITCLLEKPLQSVSQAEGFRSRRNLSRGTILTTAAIEPVPDVERGRELAIVYVDGLFRISAAGVALEAGVVGDYVKVKNKQSGKVIVARIVDNFSAAVDP